MFGTARLFCLLPSAFLQYTSTSTAAGSADFTTSSNFLACVLGSFSLGANAGTDFRPGGTGFTPSVTIFPGRMGAGGTAPSQARVSHVLRQGPARLQGGAGAQLG